MTKSPARFDVVISGASFTGLALARALSDALGPRARIALVERSANPLSEVAPNPRAFALSRASQQMLNVLGAWPLVEHEAQPVTNIEITDSSLEDGIRPVVLRYDNTLDDGAPASYIVPDQVLANALRTLVKESKNIEVFAPTTIDSFDQETGFAHIHLEDGRELHTKLLVAAEGRRSKIRDQAGIKIVKWDYGQTGIVTQIAHEKPHGGMAVQHFLPAGPFAILPLVGNRSCITWSQDTDRAQQLLAAPDDEFLKELTMRIAGRLGKIELTGPRKSWPLSLHLARTYIAPRLALAGDTAHGAHPIAGQGLNLGLRDVAALAQLTAETWRLGLDIGAYAGNGNGLEAYEKWRRFDNTTSALGFDGLNKLFSNDWTLMRAARTTGLSIVDRIPALKHMFVTEAAGLSGDVPRLLKGEPV